MREESTNTEVAISLGTGRRFIPAKLHQQGVEDAGGSALPGRQRPKAGSRLFLVEWVKIVLMAGILVFLVIIALLDRGSKSISRTTIGADIGQQDAQQVSTPKDLVQKITEIAKNKNLKDQEKVAQITLLLIPGLSTQLDTIHQNSPANTYRLREDFFWQGLKFEQVADLSTNPEIGGAYTMVAMKNKNSYCLATDKNGYVLYEGGKKINDGHFKENANFFKSIVYVKDVDAYFMVLSHKIYKKQINGLNPDLWLDGNFGSSWITPFEYSSKNKRIFTTIAKNAIAVIDPKTQGVEFQLRLDFTKYIQRYRFIGKNHEYVVFGTWNRHLGLFKYDTKAKTGHLVTKVQVQSQHCPYIDNLEVDSTEKVLLVSCLNAKLIQANLAVYELRNNRFTFKSSVAYTGDFKKIRALVFYKYYDNFATFIAMDSSSQGLIDVVRYDIHTGELSRENEKILASGAANVGALQRLGELFYLAGQGGQVCRVRLVDSRKGG